MTDLIAPHLTHCTATGKSAATVEAREGVLRRADRELPLGLDQATTDELAAWLANPKWSAQTRATFHGHLVGYYRWAADPRRSHGLDFDPSVGLPRPRVPRRLPHPVSNDEVVLALTTLPEPYRLFIELAAYAGLRAGEVARLDRDDVTQARITIRGKGGKQRVVRTHEVVWASVGPLRPGPVAMLNGQPMTAYQVSHRTAYNLRRIGLRKVTLHWFRHWFATTVLASPDVNLRTVQELLGHSSVETTAIYTYVTDEQREIAIGALPVLVPTPN